MSSWWSPQFAAPSPLLNKNSFFIHATSSPLTDLGLILELLDSEKDSHVHQEYVHQAQSNLKHLQNLFKLLQNPDHRASSHFLVHQALNELQFRFHQPHRLKFLISSFQVASDLKLKGNVFYFQEALSCLLSNAFAAYPAPHQPKTVWFSAIPSRQSLTFHIGDVGQGMSWLNQQLIHINSLVSRQRGHGIGLGFCRSVIENQFHGSLRGASFPGMGTVWIIKIPVKS